MEGKPQVLLEPVAGSSPVSDRSVLLHCGNAVDLVPYDERAAFTLDFGRKFPRIVFNQGPLPCLRQKVKIPAE